MKNKTFGQLLAELQKPIAKPNLPFRTLDSMRQSLIKVNKK